MMHMMYVCWRGWGAYDVQIRRRVEWDRVCWSNDACGTVVVAHFATHPTKATLDIRISQRVPLCRKINPLFPACASCNCRQQQQRSSHPASQRHKIIHYADVVVVAVVFVLWLTGKPLLGWTESASRMRRLFVHQERCRSSGEWPIPGCSLNMHFMRYQQPHTHATLFRMHLFIVPLVSPHFGCF